MKLTVALTISLILCLNSELASTKSLKSKIRIKYPLAANDDKMEARQSYPTEDDYYDEEEDEEEEDELQLALNEQNYDGSAGGQGEGHGAQEPEEEDDNEDDEGDEEGEDDGEERFLENSGILRKIFSIL